MSLHDTWNWIKDHPYATAGIIAGILLLLWWMGFFGGKAAPQQGATASDYYNAAAAASQAAAATNIAQTQAQIDLQKTQTGAKAATDIADLTGRYSVQLAGIQADVAKGASHDALDAYLHALDTGLSATENTNSWNFSTVANTNEADVQKTLAGFQAQRDETTTLANKDIALATTAANSANYLGELNLAGQQEAAYGKAYNDKIAGLVSVGASPNELAAATGFTPLDLSSWKQVWPTASQGYADNIKAYGKAVFGPSYGT